MAFSSCSTIIDLSVSRFSTLDIFVCKSLMVLSVSWYCISSSSYSLDLELATALKSSCRFTKAASSSPIPSLYSLISISFAASWRSSSLVFRTIKDSRASRPLISSARSLEFCSTADFAFCNSALVRSSSSTTALTSLSFSADSAANSSFIADALACASASSATFFFSSASKVSAFSAFGCSSFSSFSFKLSSVSFELSSSATIDSCSLVDSSSCSRLAYFSFSSFSSSLEALAMSSASFSMFTLFAASSSLPSVMLRIEDTCSLASATKSGIPSPASILAFSSCSLATSARSSSKMLSCSFRMLCNPSTSAPNCSTVAE
mmetsp:Transcript_11819/g.43195  ORF Transcript_11819/g.43195 Transcript_11819/m.43195 type:complete len:320 (-) Transcript_11819:832-1791(-)